MDTSTHEAKYTVIPIRRYTLKELSKLYGVHRETFLKWLKPFQKELGKRNGNYYSIAQVNIVFQKLDMPSPPDEEENDSEKNIKRAA